MGEGHPERPDRLRAIERALESEAFQMLSTLIREKPEMTPQALSTLIISRNLERVGDHATNIAEDVIFWVRGADVRHHTNSDEA